MRVNSIQDLEQYVLRKLGKPLINVEVSDDQLRDCIDDALQYFFEESYEGSVEKALVLDTTTKATEYAMPSNILSVVGIIRWGEDTGLGDSENLWSVGNILWQDGYLRPFTQGGGGALGYVQSVQEYLKTINFMFSNNRQLYDFSPASSKIYFTDPPDEDFVILKVYETIDGTSAPNLYNHRWIKAYTVALTKIQWGQHLSKYTVTMPGGTSINADAIKTEGEDAKTKLEEELYDKYSAPADFIMA